MFQAFHLRIWVVSIQHSPDEKDRFLNDTFIVSEDSFNARLEWMVQKGYDAHALERVELMKVSQVYSVKINNHLHSLIRVK